MGLLDKVPLENVSDILKPTIREYRRLESDEVANKRALRTAVPAHHLGGPLLQARSPSTVHRPMRLLMTAEMWLCGFARACIPSNLKISGERFFFSFAQSMTHYFHHMPAL
jgi:hypothetical protein